MRSVSLQARINWNDEAVLRALAEYRDGRIGTQAELSRVLQAMTGFEVKRSTLSDRIRGISTQRGKGRPLKRPLAHSNNQSVQVSLFCALSFELPLLLLFMLPSSCI